MNKKGFTLIELLAVIIILGVIALIATPIILNIIDDARKSADEKSVQLYIKAVNNKIAERRLNNSKVEDGDYSVLQNGDICLYWSNNTCIETLGLSVSNSNPDGGQITVEDGELTFYTFQIENNQYQSSDLNLCFNFINGAIKNYYSHVNNDSTAASCPKNVSIPDKINGKEVKSIAADAFKYTAVTSVTIPSGVTSIGNNAFKNCTNLTSISIPNTVTSIGTSAFRDCSELTSITLPSNLTTISQYMLRGCSKLISITIPSNVESIGGRAFLDSGLTSALFQSPDGWYDTALIPSTTLSDPSSAAIYLKKGFSMTKSCSSGPGC